MNDIFDNIVDDKLADAKDSLESVLMLKVNKALDSMREITSSKLTKENLEEVSKNNMHIDNTKSGKNIGDMFNNIYRKAKENTVVFNTNKKIKIKKHQQKTISPEELEKKRQEIYT
ncbi:MAG: hypothetical protein PHG08_00515 [Bacilli bacterium]|nr:hypothetical protein [Bacilli bacterium]